ncbi:MAG: GNAT family N-acetyltransferase [bacterium]
MTHGATLPVTMRRATTADAALLASLAATTFSDTFGAANTPEDMALYLAKAFGEDTQRSELADPRHIVFLAECAGEVAGYAMLRDGAVSDAVGDANAIEIARFYATKAFLGAGIGAALMQRCLDEAAARGRSTIWLAVWEQNPRAIAFYGRWGFREAGTTTFMLGHDLQTDRLMARRVAAVAEEKLG